MAGEFMSDAELDAIEARADAEAMQLNASLGEYDENPEFEFCKDCPRLGEVAKSELPYCEVEESMGINMTFGLGSSVYLTRRYKTREGKFTREMLLGSMPGHIMTTPLIDKLRSDGAKATRECSRPVRAIPSLGILSSKKCAALDVNLNF